MVECALAGGVVITGWGCGHYWLRVWSLLAGVWSLLAGVWSLLAGGVVITG